MFRLRSFALPLVAGLLLTAPSAASAAPTSIINGTAGPDQLVINADQTYTLNGVLGTLNPGTLSVYMDAGDDTVTADTTYPTVVNIHGGDGNDTLIGGAGDDGLLGENGDDTLRGRSGGDFLSGGAGNDTLRGGVGQDNYDGGDGADTIHSADGWYDVIRCGQGIDDASNSDTDDYEADRDCERSVLDTDLPLSASRADGTSTFSYKVPAGTKQSAILMEAMIHQYGKSELVIDVTDQDSHPVATSAGTSGSTLHCQQYGGPDQWTDPMDADVTVTHASAQDIVTITTDDPRLSTYMLAKAVVIGDDIDDVCAPDGVHDTLRLASDMNGEHYFGLAPVAPVAPAHVNAVAGDGQVELSWDAAGGAGTTYNVFVDGVQVHRSLHGTAFTVGGLENGRSYSFEIEATNPDGTSARSTVVAATPQAAPVIPPVDPQPPVTPVTPQPPAVPVGPTCSADKGWLLKGKLVAAPAKAKRGKLTGTSVTVRLPKAPKGAQLVAYVRAANAKCAVKVPSKPNRKRALTIKGLTKNTAYTVTLVKVNQAGQQSAASKPLKVTTAPSVD